MSLLECPRRESNPYRRCGRQDFKSCVSTSSTTGAIFLLKSFSGWGQTSTVSGHPDFHRDVSTSSTTGALCLEKELRPPGELSTVSAHPDFHRDVSTSSTTGVIHVEPSETKNPNTVVWIFLERKTGLEPATPTLARSCSTK